MLLRLFKIRHPKQELMKVLTILINKHLQLGPLLTRMEVQLDPQLIRMEAQLLKLHRLKPQLPSKLIKREN